jgi:hypothetical protein
VSERLTDEQIAEVAAHIGNAKPASLKLLVAFGEAVRDCREHEHPKGSEDFHCLNLAAWMGERAALVLRNLLNAEADNERLQRQVDFWETAAQKNGELYAAAENQRDEARERIAELEKHSDRLPQGGGALPMPAGPAPLPVGKLTEYTALNLGELMDADSAAIVDSMRARLIGEVTRLRCELAEARHPAGEQVTEWGVQLADGGYTTPHRSREDADANLRGLRAHGETAYLVTRTATHSQWEVTP